MSTMLRDRPIRLLLIDDDPDDYVLTREVVSEISSGSYSLDWEQNYAAGVEAVCQGQHDVYLIDYRIGERTGIELWREARSRSCLGPMILLTGQSEYEIDQAALAAGAAEFLEKDRLEARILERAIRYAIRQHENERALEEKVAQRTADLKAANEALQDAAKKKDEFLATLGHELRNPLAPIRNALEIMRLSGGNPDVTQRACGILDRQVRTMVRLIDDLLDVARFFTGKFRLNCERFDLRNAAKDAIEAAEPLFEKAGLTLSVNLPGEPITVSGDRLRMAQVLTNVLANATKYTEDGGRCELAISRAGGAAVISVVIRAWVSPPVLPTFFAFHANRSDSGPLSGGLGIGLALVHKLVAMHGGTVTA
ncbi:MAG: hybrid sensor histidine kinase/response regulator [Gemmataceae bacterium]